MSLKEKINEDLKASMKAKDTKRLEALRAIRNEIIKMDKSGMDREMNEEEEIQLLLKQAKMRKEAIEMFEEAGRDDLIVKESVDRPSGYVVPSESSGPFMALMDRHQIPFEIIKEAKILRVEQCRLMRIEEETDALYNRYAGRQIVERDTILDKKFTEGALFLPARGDYALRTMLLMEPLKLYGLFEYDEFRKQVAGDGTLPVYRLIREIK